MTTEYPLTTWETCTKVVVIISTLLAEITQNGLVARDTFLLSWMGSAILVGTLLLARQFPSQILCLVLVLLYILRGLTFAVCQHVSHGIPVTAFMLGLMLSSLHFRTWALPRQWQFPLVLWAVVVALSWPIIFLRELDFAPTQTLRALLVNNGAEVPTTVAAAWVPTMAATQGIGFLWIDWLFATFGPHQREKFERSVLIPLGIGFLLTLLVAFYQALGDIRFLNIPSWIDSGRAPGGMLDANPFGVLAACWGAAFIIFVLTSPYRGRYPLAGLMLTLCWLGMLFSGSRSALVVAALTAIPLLWSVRSMSTAAQQRVWLRQGLAGMLLVGVLIGVFAPSALVTPFQRFWNRLPRDPAQWTLSTIAEWQFIERILFARTAARMVEEVPLTGVGIGSFHTLSTDYAHKYGIGQRLPFDNALNWYLHQLAELGLIGSIGWMAWIIVYVHTLLRPRAPGEMALPVILLRCLLVAFGIVSLLGVHAQNPEMLLTFWTYTFWLFTLLSSSTSPEERDITIPAEARPRWKLWATIIGVGCMYAVLQGYVSVQILRVPYRAAAAHWSYTYGFYPWEQMPDGNSFRWTQQKAVTVIPVQGPWLCFTMWVSHPDGQQKPVHTEVWINGQRAITLSLREAQFAHPCVAMPENTPRITMTLQVDRTWRPLDYDRGDPRELGVAVTPWTFAQSPPDPAPPQ